MTRRQHPPVMRRRWYLHPAYLYRYTLREMSAVFVLLYAVVLLLGVIAVSRGPEAFAGYQQALTSPWSVGLHLLMLIAAVYNSVTWFQVAPKAMPPLFIGTRKLGDRPIVLAHFAGFVAVTVMIFAAVIWAY